MSKSKAIASAIVVGLLASLCNLLFEGLIVTPLLALCWLLFLARFCEWKVVFVAFIVLAIFVFFSLISESLGTIMVRTSSFLIGGSLAVAFSKARQRSFSALDSAHGIIKAIPSPIVAANLTGEIVAASDAAQHLLPAEFGPLLGHSFADVFLGHLSPGYAMKIYLDWYYSGEARDETLQLCSGGQVPISARILSVGEGTDRLLLASFQEP